MRIIAFISDASDVGEMPIYLGDPQTWGPCLVKSGRACCHVIAATRRQPAPLLPKGTGFPRRAIDLENPPVLQTHGGQVATPQAA